MAGMDLTQLQYFRTVARLENMTQAARELYVSQPTLSQSIARLEDTLGTTLFDRQKGKLRLNEAGRIFLNRIDRAFLEIDNGVNELLDYRTGHQSRIVLASSMIDVFKEIILHYLDTHPDCCISHNLTSNSQIMNLLRGNDVDFVITPEPIDDPQVDCFPLYEDEVFAVVGESHPLFSRTAVALDELADYPVVCDQCCSGHYFVRGLFEEIGRIPNIRLESTEHRILTQITEEGKVVGFLPAKVAARHLRHFTGQKPLRILDPEIRRTVSISMRKGRNLSPAAEHFYQHLIAFCREDSRCVRDFLKEYYKKRCGKETRQSGDGVVG